MKRKTREMMVMRFDSTDIKIYFFSVVISTVTNIRVEN